MTLLAVLTACGGGKAELGYADALHRPGRTPPPHQSESPAPTSVAAASSGPTPGVPASALVVALAPDAPVIATQAALATRAGIMVDTTALPVAQPGIDGPLLSAAGSIPPAAAPGDWEQDGAFRLLCNWTKMSYDDPIVHPNQPGTAHHHTFFGNTAIDAFTTPENIRVKGNAGCRGGTVNLSGYWVPSMIDRSTSKPLAPQSLLIYYKTGAWTYMNNGSLIQPLPKGLRMVGGNPSGVNATNAVGFFICMSADGNSTPRDGTKGNTIPNCAAGDILRTKIDFPQCWDGQNLDSPDHMSHMARPTHLFSNNPMTQAICPETHPVVLPLITFAVDYLVPAGADTSNWRLASDTYDAALPGGYSLHADWMNGWDPAISDLWGVKCMQERRNCGSANLGDGRVTLEFQGN